ncbi:MULTISPECIES: response regulator transcription factor [unclassified Streptomyces]|uniref:helix-turn-helix transcriptional regulator n=1 Tax=unclassified Streptomyces TaxID=2593676 RepID=UPI00343D8B6D
MIVLVVDALDAGAVALLRATRQASSARLVLVVSHLQDHQVGTAAECGVVGILWRTQATADRLIQVIRAAARGDGHLPPDLLGRLLAQVGEFGGPLQLGSGGLSEREIRVLGLVADGYDTPEISRQLCYSERTVKYVIRNIIERFHLRGRTHAVAVAVRKGLI